MKRLFKLVVLLLPFIVLTVVISSNLYRNSRIFMQTQDADGLMMGTSDNRFVVRVNRSVKNAVTTDAIVVTDLDGKVVKNASIIMDHDLYRLGFVKAMQVDGDPDLEVVAWGNNVRNGEAFFLDFADGGIIKRPIEEISGTAQDLIDAFKKTTLQSYALTVFTIIATPVYYFFLLIIFLIMMVLKRKKPEV